ncbi:MAG: HAD family phosphatase, partial [bacterium]|nr:HAD family phosphatase [bacterium]
ARLRALIFDFDGTIADSEPLHLAAFQDVIRSELGLDLTPEAYAERYLAFDDRRLFETFLRDRDRQVSAGEMARLLARKAERYEALAENPVLLPGAEALIRAAAERWPLSVASGALRREIAPVLERAGLLACFAAIVSADDVERSKPDPESFLRAREELSKAAGEDIPAEACLVLEDSVAGLAAGLAAGMRVLAVTTSYPREKLGAADRVVGSLDEVADPDALERWFAALSPRG